MSYPEVIPFLRGRLGKNTAPRYRKLALEPRLTLDLYPHQKEALERWKAARGRGLVVLPTGAGKTLLGVLTMAWAARSSLVVVSPDARSGSAMGNRRLAISEKNFVAQK